MQARIEFPTKATIDTDLIQYLVDNPSTEALFWQKLADNLYTEEEELLILNSLKVLPVKKMSSIACTFGMIGGLYAFTQKSYQNYDKGLVYLRDAATLKNTNAMVNLGLMYKDGTGVDCDFPKAIEYLEKAASLNNALAKYTLGVLYLNGFSDQITKDEVKATLLFREALSHEPAKIELATLQTNNPTHDLIQYQCTMALAPDTLGLLFNKDPQKIGEFILEDHLIKSANEKYQLFWKNIFQGDVNKMATYVLSAPQNVSTFLISHLSLSTLEPTKLKELYVKFPEEVNERIYDDRLITNEGKYKFFLETKRRKPLPKHILQFMETQARNKANQSNLLKAKLPSNSAPKPELEVEIAHSIGVVDCKIAYYDNGTISLSITTVYGDNVKLVINHLIANEVLACNNLFDLSTVLTLQPLKNNNPNQLVSELTTLISQYAMMALDANALETSVKSSENGVNKASSDNPSQDETKALLPKIEKTLGMITNTIVYDKAGTVLLSIVSEYGDTICLIINAQIADQVLACKSLSDLATLLKSEIIKTNNPALDINELINLIEQFAAMMLGCDETVTKNSAISSKKAISQVLKEDEVNELSAQRSHPKRALVESDYVKQLLKDSEEQTLFWHKLSTNQYSQEERDILLEGLEQLIKEDNTSLGCTFGLAGGLYVTSMAPQLHQKGISYLQKAVAFNNTNAMIKLAVLHEEGDGVPVDFIYAKNLYEDAAILNHPEAKFNLGKMYLEGREDKIQIDLVKAVALFREAMPLEQAKALLIDLQKQYESHVLIQYHSQMALGPQNSAISKLYESAPEVGEYILQDNRLSEERKYQLFLAIVQESDLEKHPLSDNVLDFMNEQENKEVLSISAHSTQMLTVETTIDSKSHAIGHYSFEFSEGTEGILLSISSNNKLDAVISVSKEQKEALFDCKTLEDIMAFLMCPELRKSNDDDEISSLCEKISNYMLTVEDQEELAVKLVSLNEDYDEDSFSEVFYDELEDYSLEESGMENQSPNAYSFFKASNLESEESDNTLSATVLVKK